MFLIIDELFYVEIDERIYIYIYIYIYVLYIFFSLGNKTFSNMFPRARRVLMTFEL